MQPRKVALSNGGFAIVDEEDFEALSEFSWFKVKSGRMWYAQAYLGGGRKTGRKVYMHRRIKNAKRGQMLDHKNRDGLDNRRENLRFTTRRGNAGNGRPRLKKVSPYKGVFFSRENHNWVAQIRRDDKRYHLGSYRSQEMAALAYDQAARAYYGEFAYLNFPDVTDYSMVYQPKRNAVRGSGDPAARYRQKNRERLKEDARQYRARRKK